MYPLYAIGITNYIATGTVSAYMTFVLEIMGFSTFKTNLLTIPANVINLCNNLRITYLSKRTGELTLVGLIRSTWIFTFMMAS